MRGLVSVLCVGCVLLGLAGMAWAADAEEHFVVIAAGNEVGHLDVVRRDRNYEIDFDVKDNGRGPTMRESIILDARGLPVNWKLTGQSTFGNAIDEHFEIKAGHARWVDSTGSSGGQVNGPTTYVAQQGSPWSVGLYARAMLRNEQQSIRTLPDGTLHLQTLEQMQVDGEGGPVAVTSYAMTGIEMAPSYFLLDETGALFATLSARGIVVRKGYQSQYLRLRELEVKYSTARLIDLQKQYAHQYHQPVRIRHVRLFDPVSMKLTTEKSVIVKNDRIVAVLPTNSPTTPGEVVIDGNGGTLVPGMFEMHGHLSQERAMLNVLAGITSVRDMGNDNDTLDGLVERIDSGKLAGPRLTRSGFIEGKSPYNSNNGFIVTSESEAVDAARHYAARGFAQIKIYNSMNPAWIPGLIAEAKSLGLRVAGHVPAFTNADAMIAAGYDEMTHINQVMLGWVLEPDEDTRTLLRLTALKRLPKLDLQSARVQKTINAMVKNQVAIDPTFTIHEALLLSRNGTLRPDMVDYVDHLPVGEQRRAKQAWSAIESADDDEAYRGAFKKIIATIKMMHDRGIFILPGTDLGGSFSYHRELELYELAGFSAAEILRRATLDMAAYLGQDQSLGSIKKGKLADFFLIQGDPTKDLKAIKSIRMVVKNGVFYYPSEIYPAFGIEPFTSAPKITGQ